MEQVEIDSKALEPCRLCLKDVGIYQIIPTIQHQIKYCFDIEVSAFDGGPQQICKQCESKLTEYFTVKTVYLAKQQLLMKSLKDRQENVNNVKPDTSILPTISPILTSKVGVPQEKEKVSVLVKIQDKTAESDGDKECTKENSPPVANHKTSKRKRIRIESTSSSSSESKDDDAKVKPLIIRKKKHDRRHKWHTNDYTRSYACRMCNKTYVKRNILLKHYSNIHSSCHTKYKSILNSICSVKIEKVDNKPNFTGVNNTIVLRKDKVIVNEKNKKYFVLYTLKKQHLASDEDKSKNKINGNRSSVSSDEAEYSVCKKKRKKRRRLLSSDTVVIDKKDDADLSSAPEDRDHTLACNPEHGTNVATECVINLDSDSDVEPTLENKNTDTIIEENENKLIRNVIEVCHNKYLRNIIIEKNNKPNYANIESQLMHKVLNLGRKIVNRQGLNCTGLLRYLEHRNLGVIWLPKTGHSFSGPQVRINMTTVKKDHQRNEDTVTGWTDVPLNTNRSEENFVQSLFPFKDTVNDKSESVSSKLGFDFDEIVPTQNASPVTKKYLQKDSSVNILNEPLSTDQACLYKNEDTGSCGKLLNKNPVANPKQLPKKITHYEVKQSKNIQENDMEINGNDNLLFSESIDSGNDLSGMPIITSTTSLASDYNPIESVNEESTNTNIAKSAPRIKVKPVSELMGNTSTPNNLLLNQNNYDHSLPIISNLQLQQPMPFNQTISVIQMPMAAINNVAPEGQKNNSEMFLLHTLELPNTKTDSPYSYLKSLLAIHNMYLIDVIDYHGYECLIRFKVLFKQESVKPIVLCLSLHCNSNQIYIGIKDSSNININMQDLSANWQWEIIKIFQGDVCIKINEKALSLDPDLAAVRENCTKFLFLVKSIQMKKFEV